MKRSLAYLMMLAAAVSGVPMAPCVFGNSCHRPVAIEQPQAKPSCCHPATESKSQEQPASDSRGCQRICCLAKQAVPPNERVEIPLDSMMVSDVVALPSMIATSPLVADVTPADRGPSRSLQILHCLWRC